MSYALDEMLRCEAIIANVSATCALPQKAIRASLRVVLNGLQLPDYLYSLGSDRKTLTFEMDLVAGDTVRVDFEPMEKGRA